MKRRKLPLLLLLCLPLLAVTQDNSTNPDVTITTRRADDSDGDVTTQDRIHDNDMTTARVIPGETISTKDEVFATVQNDADDGVTPEEMADGMTTVNNGQGGDIPAEEETTNARDTTIIETTVTAGVTVMENEITTNSNLTDVNANQTGTEIIETTIQLNTTTTTITTTTTVPHMAPPAGVDCGIHSEAKNNTCVCQNGWLRDPLDPKSASCLCRDLCSDSKASACPSGSQCYHLTCHVVSCRCEDNLHYDSVDKKCVDTCMLYGDSICGLGSNRKCQVSAEADVGYTCTCLEGFRLEDDTCVDVNECTSSEPCGVDEGCHNTEGSFSCSCKVGYMRNEDGACVNVNECLNPSLHTCEHMCQDLTPGFSCECHEGYRKKGDGKCQLVNIMTTCVCSDPEKGICYHPLDGDIICHPKPGFRLVNDTYEDIKECESSREQWCGPNSICTEGEGQSTCRCKDGFTNDSLSQGACVELKCQQGTVVSGSDCVDPCDLMKCPYPLKCQLSDEGVSGECHCGTECQEILDPMGQMSSVYRGSFVFVEPPGIEGGGSASVGRGVSIASNITKMLNSYFGMDAVEVLSAKPQTRRRPRDAAPPTKVVVEFVILTDKFNMAKEMKEVITSQCQNTTGGPPGTCILPGGIVVEERSINVEIRNPCKDKPCPNDLFQCLPRTDVSGRFVCDCKTGYAKVETKGSHGFCQDINECNGTSRMCKKEEECINTPGSYLCREPPKKFTEENATKDLTVVFGVLFAATLLIAIGLGYLLVKRTHRIREMVPMTETSGFENHAFHK